MAEVALRGDRPPFGRSGTAHEASKSVREAESPTDFELSEKNPGGRSLTPLDQRRVSPSGFRKMADVGGYGQPQVTRQRPRLMARRRPSRWATSLSRWRLAAKKRPSRRPSLSFCIRACQVSAVVPIKDWDMQIALS